MTLDISGDYVIFDNSETITLRQIRPDGATSVTIENAVAGVVNRQRLAAAGIEITGVEVDDIITDSANIRWRVLQTSLATLDTRWTVACRRQV